MNAFDAVPPQYPYLRIGHLGEVFQRDRARILNGVGTQVTLESADIEQEIKHGLDLVVIGPRLLESAYAPEQRDKALDTLIACEGSGIPTLLLAEKEEDLESRVAGVVSHVVTLDASVHRSAISQIGLERALLIKSTIDPHRVLLEGTGEAAALTPEAIARRRMEIDERSPKAQADAIAEWLGFTVEPLPSVTAIVVSRKAENLDVTLANLRRQQYSNVEVLLTIDPMYAQVARGAIAEWDIPARLEVSQRGGTLADRLNLGIFRAHGDLVTVFEENALYGSHHVSDLVQAVQYSGADLVGKASWHVYDEAKDRMVARAPVTQRSFGELPALGTMMMRRETARRFGFTRRASGTNWPLVERVSDEASGVYSIHAYDTVLPKKGQTLAELADRVPGSGAFPFSTT
ncbi:MAG: hypothetical protein ACTIDO_17255 [Brevibacterium aurantiacum]|uniref:hypothetical protein n=1 Tax=Brevibacterium aurantiacum TaxID=273384 RepID=UPI003F921491